MNPQTLKYLQKDQIGKVIATGLAELYINQPKKPVKYLAEWLRSYSNTEKQLAKLLKAQKQKSDVLRAYEKQQHAKDIAEKEKHSQEQEHKHVYESFKDLVTKHDYHEDLLEESLAQFVERNTRATGVYIGQLNYPIKEVKDEDTDQMAHLDTAAEKVINYVGSSASHKKLMRGKSLKINQGVTAGTFALLEEAPAPVIGEDGQEIPQPVKPKYLFVPDVVKNTSIHYFKIPKLGSYLAVPIICNEYLTQSNFDSSLQQKIEYIKQCEELEKVKKSELEQLYKEKEDFEKKLADLTEKNADETHLEPIRAQLKDVLEAIEEKQKQFVEEKEPTLIPNKKHYVICADTLGKDLMFDQSEIEFITGIANHFRDSWENKEKELLKKDVQDQIENLKTTQPENLKAELVKALELNEEEQKEVNAIPEENKKQYRQLEIQLGKLKAELTQNPLYLQSFLHLKRFRVLKYRQLVQNLLYFLGFTKTAVNTPKRASLNWREVSHKVLNQSIFHKILSYNPIGPKKQEFRAYAKTPHLADIFDKYDEEEVFKYNAALGAITQFVKKALELRELDVELRKNKFEADKKNRERIQEENEKVDAKLAEELEKHRGTLSAEDAQNFDEENWKAEFFIKHPKQDLPPQEVEDVDNDM